MSIPLFESLKDGTMDLHEEIEKWMPVFRKNFGRDEYRNHLRCVLGFYRPVEKEIRNFLSENEDSFEMSRRYKVSKLEADLASLGDVTSVTEKLPESRDVLPIRSRAEMIGTLYVLEGSTLGGQLIKKSLKEALGLKDEEMHFYRGYDAETGPMWKAFRTKALEVAVPKETAESVARARQTFQGYMDWLKQAAEKDSRA